MQVKSRRQGLWGEQTKLQLVSEVDERAAATLHSEIATPKSATEEEILRTLRSLSQGEQEVIVLSDVEELTYKEVADVLGTPDEPRDGATLTGKKEVAHGTRKLYEQTRRRR